MSQTTEELVASLGVANTQIADLGAIVDKISGETGSLVGQVATLTEAVAAAIAAGQTVPDAVTEAAAAVQAGIASLTAKLQVVDEQVTDV